jgi:hypothetical protein
MGVIGSVADREQEHELRSGDYESPLTRREDLHWDTSTQRILA